MKQTKTVLKELTAMYRAVLRHGILCNAIALGLVAAPAMAYTPQESYTAQESKLTMTTGSTVSGFSFTGLETTGSGCGAAMSINYTDHSDTTLTTIENSLFEGNHALADSEADSGAFNVAHGNVKVDNTKFLNNEAMTGGAIYAYLPNDGYAKLVIDNSVFEGNKSKAITNSDHESGGGAIVNTTKKYRNNNDAGVWISNSVFLNNQNTQAEENGGGAMNLGSESRTRISGTEFTGNTSQSQGGAISSRIFSLGANAEAVLDIVDSSFKGNIAATNGGAIDNYLYGSDVTGHTNSVYISGTTFGGAEAGEGNSAAKGGAIYNHIAKVGDNLKTTGKQTAESNINDIQIGNMYIVGSSFINNIATDNGGAIYNEGEMTINGTFDGNIANGTYTPNNDGTAATYSNGKGGAVYNTGAMTIGGTFENNNAFHGGAVYNNGTLTVSNGSVFNNNYANVEGGAIASYGDLHIGNEVLFTNNKSFIKSGDLDVVSGGSEMGAAIYSEGRTDVTRIVEIGDGVKFTNNSASGGAVYFFGANDVTIGDNVVFSGNTGNNAGALRMSNTSSNGSTTMTIGDNVKFIGNTGDTSAAIMMGNSGDEVTIGDNALFADNIGGAIWNSQGELTFGANAMFSGNKANKSSWGGVGGVLKNMGPATTTFDGATFKNNSAASVGGAIYNYAGATVELFADSGDVVFSGNTANGVANDIFNNGFVYIAASDGHTVSMDGGIVGTGELLLDDDTILNLGTASIKQASFTLDGTVNGELFNADQFAKFDVTEFSGDGELNLTLKGIGTYKVFAHDVFDTGTVNVSDSSVFTYNWNETKDTITVATKSVNEIAAAANVKTETATTIVTLANAKEGTAAQQIGRSLGAALAEGKAEYVEHETKKLAPEDKPVTHSVASSVQNQVLSLTSNRMSGGVAGRAGGDEVEVGYGAWAQGLYNKTRYLGRFDSHSTGIAVGADALIDKTYTIGIGYSFSNADVDASDERSIDIDSHTVFVYGQYKPTNWFINATLSNTVSKYTENAVVAGLPVETKYDVNAFGIQGMTGYDFASGITPMVGLRYLHVSTDGYDTLPGYVGDMNSTFVSTVGGVKYAFEIQNDSEFRFIPELRAMATYDVISDKNGATVYIPGGTSYHIAGDRMSRAGAELGVGMTTEWRGLELSLNYDLQMREDYLSHTGMLKLRYEF